MEVHKLGQSPKFPEELTTSLVLAAKRNAAGVKRDFNESLRVQAAAKEEKQDGLHNKKMVSTQEGYINASYLHQQHNSPRCWMTEEHTFSAFEGLRWGNDCMLAIKEQILICYLGLGRVEAHHPWSKKGHIAYILPQSCLAIL